MIKQSTEYKISSGRINFQDAVKKVVSIAFITILPAAHAIAQEQIWNMNDCMAYAIDNSPRVKKQIHTDDTYQAEKSAAIAAFFPSVSVGSQGDFAFGRSIDPKTNTYNDVSTFNNSYSLSASLPVFDGGQLVNKLRSAKINTSIGSTSVEKEKDDLALNVMQAYIDAVYYSGTVKLAGERLRESRQILYKTKRQEELGVKGKADVAQIESQVAAEDYNLIHQQNLLNISLLTLKSHMNFPTENSLQIDTLFSEQIVMGGMADADEIFEFASEYNPTARIATLKLRNADLQHLVSKGKLYPTISLNGGISSNYFTNLNTSPDQGSSNSGSFFKQLGNNRGEYFYVSLNIPIFGGLSRFTELRRSRNNLRIAYEDRTEVFRQLQTAIEQAILDSEGYAKEVIQMEKKVASDEISYQITLRKFEEGLMSPLDLQLSSNNLLLSKANLLQCRLTLIIKQKLVDYYRGTPLVIVQNTDIN